MGRFLNLKCVLIDFTLQNLSLMYFVYQKALKPAFKVFFWYKIPSELCVCVVKSQGLFVVKNWN